jgi:hypothetical protein
VDQHSAPTTDPQSDEYGKLIEREYQKALSKAQPLSKGKKSLLPHEADLLERGELKNITHKGATSIWLEAPSSVPKKGQTNVYRPMGDTEVLYLLEHLQLPGGVHTLGNLLILNRYSTISNYSGRPFWQMVFQ